MNKYFANNEQNVADMTREELEAEVTFLRTKYVWGLQPEDFICSISRMVNPHGKPAQPYSEEEYSFAELRTKLQQSLKHNFLIHDWVEDVQQYAAFSCSEEDWRLIASMLERLDFATAKEEAQ